MLKIKQTFENLSTTEDQQMRLHTSLARSSLFALATYVVGVGTPDRFPCLFTAQRYIIPSSDTLEREKKRKQTFDTGEKWEEKKRSYRDMPQQEQRLNNINMGKASNAESWIESQ